MKKNKISLSIVGYDILKYFEACEDLSTSEVIEFSLIVFNYLYETNPNLLTDIMEAAIYKSKY